MPQPKKTHHETPTPLILIIALIIAILISVLVSFGVVSTTREIAVNEAINNYISSLKNGECEFLDIPNELKTKILNSIVINENFKIKPQYSSLEYNNKRLSITVDINSPSLPYSLFKLYPQLFTYTNTTFLSSQLNNMSPDEYINMVCSSLSADLFVSKNIYKETIKIDIIKDTKNKWYIESPDQLDNFILGNIYSCQNNDVSFLTFKSLIYPSIDSAPKTSSSGVSALFSDTSTAVTYSNPDLLIPLGDSARYNGKITDTDIEKTDICLSISKIADDNDGMIVTFKMNNNTEANTKQIPPELFGIYESGQIKEYGVGDSVTLSSEPTEVVLKFQNKSDIIVFNAFENPLYFSTK